MTLISSHIASLHPASMRVAVFCGESTAHEHIVSAAAALGRLCAERHITLVCFGTSAVTACGRACQSAGGTVVTVVNQATLNSLSSDVVSTLPNVIVGADVHACKALSYALGDAVLVLPGGLEIIDAAFEAACWSQLGCHGAVGRPVGMLNIDNFFGGILKQVAHGVQTGFIHQKFGNLQVTADTPEKLLELVAALELPAPVCTSWPPFPFVEGAKLKVAAIESKSA